MSELCSVCGLDQMFDVGYQPSISVKRGKEGTYNFYFCVKCFSKLEKHLPKIRQWGEDFPKPEEPEKKIDWDLFESTLKAKP